MKKVLTLTVLTLCIYAYSFGQTNIYGGDFESWKFRAGWNYYEPDSSIFSTLNILDSVGAGITVYRCDTVHSGKYSARLRTSELVLGPPPSIIIPGVIGTIKIDWAFQRAILGIPYPYGSQLPVRFTGWYQSYPVAGDSTAAVLLLSKWSTTNHRRDTIAYNRLAFHGTINSWTQFDVPINYGVTSTVPDTLTILLLSCGGYNASNMFGSVGQVGTIALFDDVNLTGVNGVPLKVIPSGTVKLSPNPASQNLKIELGNSIENGLFEIYDAQGKMIKTIKMNGKSGNAIVSDLSAGMYYYKLTKNNNLLNSGTFVVTK